MIVVARAAPSTPSAGIPSLPYMRTQLRKILRKSDPTFVAVTNFSLCTTLQLNTNANDMNEKKLAKHAILIYLKP